MQLTVNWRWKEKRTRKHSLLLPDSPRTSAGLPLIPRLSNTYSTVNYNSYCNSGSSVHYSYTRMQRYKHDILSVSNPTFNKTRRISYRNKSSEKWCANNLVPTSKKCTVSVTNDQLDNGVSNSCSLWESSSPLNNATGEMSTYRKLTEMVQLRMHQQNPPYIPPPVHG